MEIIKKIWPEESPFSSLANDITDHLKYSLPDELLNKLKFQSPINFRYNLRALPNEIENGIATSLIFSSWNAITYVGQINNEKILNAEKNGRYSQHVQSVLQKYKSLWFNNEMLIIERLG